VIIAFIKNYVITNNMISLPDFKEKQILFVQTERGVENKLQFQNDNIIFKKDDKNINKISCYKVFTIFIIGDFTITSYLIRNCKKYGISMFFLKNNFEVYASLNSELEGNYLLREKQYNPKDEFETAKKLIKNKTYNQLVLLKEKKKIIDLKGEYEFLCKKIDSAKDNEQLLGIEGSLSRNFFANYFKDCNWIRRMPRTKYDINNVLLDIGYTFLFNFIDSLLKLHGFDTYKGIYHKLFFQRKSLSCDIMEPFRCLIDKELVKAYNLGQIDENDFKEERGKYVLAYDKQRKYLEIFFKAIINRKEDVFIYVKNFYYFFMNNKDFPFFKIK